MATKKPRKLTLKQARFVQGVLDGLTQCEAAVEAGFSARSAEQQAVALMKVPEVAARINEVLRRRSEHIEVDAERILAELARIGLSNVVDAFDDNGLLKPLKELPLDLQRAIQSVEVEEIFDGRGRDRVRVGTLTKVKLWDKTRGLEMLGKNLKLFTEVHEVKLTDLGERLSKARQRAADR